MIITLINQLEPRCFCFAVTAGINQYVVVKNLAEAEYVASYIEKGGNKAEFLEMFKNAISEGFDPDKVRFGSFSATGSDSVRCGMLSPFESFARMVSRLDVDRGSINWARDVRGISFFVENLFAVST